MLHRFSKVKLPTTLRVKSAMMGIAAMGGHITNNGPPGYALLATEMGYSDARSAANAVRTVIRKFQSHMKSCISDYLPIKDITDSENRVEQEFSEILELLSKPGILDRELFDDVIGDGTSKIEPDDSKSSFINLPEQSSNF